MDVLQYPRFTGKTPDENVEEIKNFIFRLVPYINDMQFELDRQIREAKGEQKDGNV